MMRTVLSRCWSLMTTGCVWREDGDVNDAGWRHSRRDSVTGVQLACVTVTSRISLDLVKMLWPCSFCSWPVC